MSYLKTYDQQFIDSLTNVRKGETKFGERVKVIESSEHLQEQLIRTDAKYVLFGIPEDIGVRANHGVPGATTAWLPTLTALLNIQQNKYHKGQSVLVLGHLDFSELLSEAQGLDPKIPEQASRLYELIAEIDKEVAYLTYQIVSAKKKPIVIGGGHNNAYGILKGTSLAHNAPINTVNLDAHTDLRGRNGRHSGNGFSTAMAEGFLDHYFIFGLHENYTSKKILDKLEKLEDQIQYNTYEAIEVRGEKSFRHQLFRAMEFVKRRPYGIEVDVDAIANIPSSAQTPVGFTTTQARQFVDALAAHKNASYLHICEAAPNEDDSMQLKQTGKFLAYLVSDFI